MVKTSASYFLAHKLAVFQCKQDKRPVDFGWDELEWWMVDAEEADEWLTYGIQLTSDWLVIDVDLYKPEAPASFERLKRIVDLSNAFICQTARGGYHYWLKNDGRKLRKNHPDYPGIDFLTNGCYVIGPGSHNQDGSYKHTHGTLPDCEPASEVLLDLLVKVDLAVTEAIAEINLSLEQDRYKQWLLTQPPATEGENGNDYTYQMASYAKDFGLTQLETFEAMWEWNLTCQPPWSKEELESIIDHAQRYSQNARGKAAIDFRAFNHPSQMEDLTPTISEDELYEALHPGTGLTMLGDQIKPNRTNMRIILLHERYRGLFSWDMFRLKISLNHIPPWRADKRNVSLEMTESDWIELRVDLAIQHRIEPAHEVLEDSVRSIAYVSPIHPICDWLSGLQWDGKPRFNLLFGDTHYQTTIAKIFLLASIYRIFHPGYKFDHMLVLAGKQGLGKSYLISVLGGEFTKVLANMPTDHRGLQAMRGAWWIEMPEMSALKKADINQVKAFITTTVDSYTPMYGRYGVQDFPRVSIPVWTLNPNETGFLKDDQNRRFLIIDQNDAIDIPLVKQNRDQIFAEAMELYRQGVEPWILVKTIEKETEAIADSHKDVAVELPDVWLDSIAEWIETQPFNLCNAGQNKERRIKTRDVFQGALGSYREIDYDHKSTIRVAKCLKELGFNRKKANSTNYFVKEYEVMLDEFDV